VNGKNDGFEAILDCLEAGGDYFQAMGGQHLKSRSSSELSVIAHRQAADALKQLEEILCVGAGTPAVERAYVSAAGAAVAVSILANRLAGPAGLALVQPPPVE